MHAAAPVARQHLSPGDLPRHRHGAAYLTLVVAGGYEEAGDRGRWRVRPGDVIVHRAFEAHLNRVPAATGVVNLPLADDALAPFGRIGDLDAVVRALGDPAEALARLRAQFAPLTPPVLDWPDDLARALGEAEPRSLGDWARARRLSPEHVARGFRQVFGVPPRRFRAEARAQAALRDLAETDAPLAAIAAARGFADQPHMTRAVAALTGRTPGAWRRSTGFKTEA